MKIAIEASVLQRVNKTGVDYYTKGLVQSVISQMPASTFFIGYFSLIRRTKPDIIGKNVVFKPIRWLSWRVYNLFFRYLMPIPYDIAAGIKADVVFYPNFVYWPLARIKKSVVIIHDTAYIDHPQYVPPKLRRYLSRFVPRALRKANHIVVNSKNTKQSLTKHYGKPFEKKLTVVNPAVDHSIYRPAKQIEVETVKRKYGVQGEYLLYLGTIEPRKNVASIIRAYTLLPSEVKDKYQLVLAGGKGWLDEEINKLVENSNPSQVVKTGYVDEVDVPALYGGAKLFLYPSNFEGWGMQVLEAMACGTPVITANNSSLPEVGGKAAIYVKAGDDAQLKNSIQSLLDDESEYANRVKLGLEHVKKFSWVKAGKQLKEVLEEI